MGRAHLRHMSPAYRDQRQSIGDAHVDAALAALKKQAQAQANLMTSYTPSREATIDMLFKDDDIEAMKRVKGLVDPGSAMETYKVGAGVELTIDYREGKIPTIENTALSIHGDRIEPLLAHIAEVRAIHEKFEEVKGVLKWFNRNATPGAIRYYWPTAMKLTPKAKVWDDLQDVPSRYNTPENIGYWMQAIKDSAATVVSAALMPDGSEPKPQQRMWLTFGYKTVDLGGGNLTNSNCQYVTDTMSYNL